MKKKNTLNVVLTFAIMIFAIIAVCVLFAPAFTDTVRGTGWDVIFQNKTTNGNFMVPELIGAFVLEALCFVLSFFLFFLHGKGKGGMYIFIAALALVAGVLFLFGKQFYLAHNPQEVFNKADWGVGGAFITTAIFDFLVFAVALGGAYAGKHEAALSDDND